MKDYYYILGLQQNASEEDIKKAYRKLSLKFHPDKNDGDEFFSERFREINEAYEILKNPTSRKNYDSKRTTFSSTTQSSNNGFNFTPVIEYFKVNKTTFFYDEEIVFTWKTLNSDKVILQPFGSVQPIGQKTYRIKDFKNPTLTFFLQAENTAIDKNCYAKLVIQNGTYQQLLAHFKSIIENDSKGFNQEKIHKENSNKTFENTLGQVMKWWIIIGVIASVIAYLIKN